MKRIILSPRLCTITAGLLCLAFSAGVSQANPKVYERALQSTGWVISPSEKTSAMGTCWVADRDKKLVITSYHLVGESKEVLVYFPHHLDGKLKIEARYYLKKLPTINGKVVATDPKCDLALIQLESLPAGVQALPLATDSSRPGDDVHSVGNSGLSKNTGMLWRYTRGNVRQVYQQQLKTPDGIREVHLVETQSPVNMGDSGGALLNDKAEVVGVAAAYDPKERLVSHNIDVAEVRAFLKNAAAELDKPSTDNDKASEPKSPVFTLVGTWKISATLQDGTQAQGEAEFKKDGTYVLSDAGNAEDESQRGRYAYANGILLLISEDRPVSLKLNWNNRDRFSGTMRGVELSFDR